MPPAYHLGPQRASERGRLGLPPRIRGTGACGIPCRQERASRVRVGLRPRCLSLGVAGSWQWSRACPLLQCCQTLLSHRVDPALRDDDGYTAAELAEYHGHRDCAQYLRDSTQPVSLAAPSLPGPPVLPAGELTWTPRGWEGAGRAWSRAVRGPGLQGGPGLGHGWSSAEICPPPRPQSPCSHSGQTAGSR